MPLGEFLSNRLRERIQKQQQKAQREAQKAAIVQDIKQKATLMREMLQDPRYQGYVELLQDAERGLASNLRTFVCAKNDQGVPLGDATTLLSLGRIQGQLDFIHSLLTLPTTFMALAEEGASPEGNGSTPNPHATEANASSGR